MVNRFFFIILFFFSGLITFAQNSPEKRATISAQKECLENVLSSITKQTGVRFSYNSQLIDPATKITVTAQNKTVKEILSAILPPSVSYKTVGEYIVFSRKKVVENQPIEKTEQKKEEKKQLSDNGIFPDSCLNEKDTVILTNQEIDMKSKELMLAAAMLTTVTTTPVLAQDTLNSDVQPPQIEQTQTVQTVQEEITPVKCKPAQITAFYPLGTGWVKSAENCYRFSCNIWGGVTGQIEGVELGGLFNINKYGAKGAQFAGLFNATGAKNGTVNSHNVQFAGIFNHTKKGKSVQFAGIFNNGDSTSFQAAGIGNVAKQAKFQAAGIFNINQQGKSTQLAGIFNGGEAAFQAAGIFNYGKTSNFQAAGIGNVAKQAKCQIGGIFNTNQKGNSTQFAGIFNVGDSASFQAAGIGNVAKSRTKCQIAGIFNTAKESSCQISGIVNVTKKGRFQMGLVNVRDTADGVSLGLINIVKKGGVMEAGIEAGEFIHTAATFRSGVPRLYTIISAGVNYTEKFFSIGAGLGTSVKLVGNLNMNFELTAHSLYKGDGFDDSHSLIQFSPMLSYRFAKHFKMYVGPSLNLFIQKDWTGDSGTSDLVKVPYSFYSQTSRQGYAYDMWVGVVGGIKF